MSENTLLLNRAESAVMSRDYALAARLYTTLLKEDPENIDLLKRLGNVFVKSGDDKKAQGIYEKLLSLEPNNADTLLSLGGIYRRVKLYDKSIDVLNKALKAGAKDVQVYYNLGFTYKFQEKFEDAIDCFETVVALNPNDVLAYNHIGSIYELKKKYDDAIQAYQTGLKVDQHHPILHFNLAKTFEESGNTEGAIREYEAALRYKPGWKEAYVNYARLLFKDGKLKAAEAVTEQAIKVNEESARLQSLMGDIYLAQDYYEGAEERYKKSLKSDPKRIKALLGLAQALECQDKNAEALEVVQRAKEIAPESEKVAKRAASVDLSAQKYSAANKEIEGLFQKNKDDLEALDLKGQYLICSDDEKGAEDCYKKIETFNPTYKKHLKNASKRFKQRGDLKKAQAYIKKFLAESPRSDSRSYVALAQIEEALGNVEAALAAYNKALESDSGNKLAKKASARLASSVGSSELAENAVDESLDLNGGFDEVENLEINMGQEELAPQEDESQDDNVLTEDDFDFDAFGKSPLLDDEPEVDFGSIAGITEKAEDEDEKAGEMGLLDENDSTIKDKIEKEDLPDEIPLDAPAQDEPEAMSEPEPETAPEPVAEAEPEAEAQKPEAPKTREPLYPPQDAVPGIDEDELERRLERQKKELAREYDKKLDALSRENQDLMDKMSEVEENAQKASAAAEKAWFAAQKAADNAQLAEQTNDAMNERMEEMAEEAAKKAAEALEEIKASQEAAQAPEAAEADEPSEKFDDLFDDILGTSVPGEEDEAFADDAESDTEPEPEAQTEEESVEEPQVEPEPEPEPEPMPEAEPEPQTEEAAEVPETFDSAAEKAAAMIPAIENILRQEKSARDFSSEIKMFKALRALSESLPPEDRREFLQSRTRVSLDYLISKLEGRPGLLKTSAALRKSGELSDCVKEEDVDTDYTFDELARIVVTDMKALSGFLEEDDLVIALNKLADNFLNGQE